MKNTLLPVPEGYKIRIEHYHNGEDSDKLEWLEFDPPRYSPIYATRAEMFDVETGDKVVEAWALCSPKDCPSRKLGRLIAHNRAIKEFYSVVQLGIDLGVL